MKRGTTLTGKWIFIGAEKKIGTQWRSAEYVKGMAWEFFPQYFSQDKAIGNIFETSPEGRPMELSYLYNNRDKQLKVEIFTDCAIGKDDKSEADLYDVSFIDGESGDEATVKTIILSLHDFRYTLQEVDD